MLAFFIGLGVGLPLLFSKKVYAGTTTYDFTNWQTDPENAWHAESQGQTPFNTPDEVDAGNANYVNPNGGPFSSGDFGDIEANDSSWATTSIQTTGFYDTQYYKFVISESESNVSELYFKHIGKNSESDGYFYIWNDSSGSWEQKGTFGSGETTNTATISSSVGDYIDADSEIWMAATGKQASGGVCPIFFYKGENGWSYGANYGNAGGLGFSGYENYPFQPPRPLDYAVIPQGKIESENGKISFLSTPGLPEIDYVDWVGMEKVYHPPGTELYSAMPIYEVPTSIEDKLHTVRNPRTPESVVGNGGENLLPHVGKEDGNYMPMEETTKFAYDNVIIDLGELDDPEQIKLLLKAQTKWVDEPPWIYKKDFVEVYKDGEWENVGATPPNYSRINIRTFAVDITDWFPENVEDYKIKLNHWHRVCYDYIAFDTSEDAIIYSENLNLESAEIFGDSPPSVNSTSWDTPQDFLFSTDGNRQPYSKVEGNFTRYGDVTSLLENVDEKFVISAFGDYVREEFNNEQTFLDFLTEWGFLERSYVRKSESYYKLPFVKNLFGREHIQPKPLPFHDMSYYPYPENESFPWDNEHQEWWDEYQTRYIDPENSHNTLYTDYVKVDVNYTPANNPPDEPSNPSPDNEAVGVPTDTTLSVYVSDPDGDDMNVSFYWDNDDFIESVTGVPSGSRAETSPLSLSDKTSYSWYASAYDGSATTVSGTWNFTTEDPPIPSNPSPSDGAWGVSTDTTLSVYVEDNEGDSMDVSFYWENGDLIETIAGVSSGTRAETSSLSIIESSYKWYVIVDDGTLTTRSDNWYFDTYDEPTWNGAEGYYEIGKVDELAWMKHDLDNHYVLVGDVDAIVTRDWNSGAGFEPIGDIFIGTFDGNGYIIESLFINRPNASGVGLFRDASYEEDGIIENVGLVGGSISGGNKVGGLVGSGGKVSNCFLAVDNVSGGGEYIGGLVGICGGGGPSVKNSYSAVDNVSGGEYVGGLVGRATGGIIEDSYSSVKNVSGTSAGGFAGGGSYGDVANSFWDNGVCNQDISSLGTAKTTENMKNVRTFTDESWSVGLDDAWDFADNPYDDNSNENIWDIDPDNNNGYPFLRWPAPTPEEWNDLENWSGSAFNTTSWGDIEGWSGSVLNASEWSNITSWSGNLSNVAGWNDKQAWSGSVRNVLNWHDVGTLSGSVKNVSNWEDLEAWSGEVKNVPSWHGVSSWDGSVSNTSAWSDIESWSGAVEVVEAWYDMVSWAGDVANTATWLDKAVWTGTVSNTASWHDKVAWTGEINNVASWNDITSWSGTIQNIQNWHDIEDWTGSVANTAVWNDVTSWNGSVINSAMWHDKATLTGDVFNSAVWNDVESWDGVVKNVEAWHNIESISGSVKNTTQWQDKIVWTGTVQETVSNWNDIKSWSETLSNTASWHDRVSWTGSLNNTAVWNDIRSWSGSLSSIVSWNDIISWTGELSNVSAWHTMADWTGSVSNVSVWHDIENWTGAIKNIQNWYDMESWSGSVVNQPSWQDKAALSGDIVNSATWHGIKSWSGSVANVASWNDISSWTGDVKVVEAWYDIESWGGSVANTASWNDVSSWNGTVEETVSSWNDIGSWAGSVKNISQWHDIKIWSGSVEVVEEWYDIQSWSGSAANVSSWSDMVSWSGSVEETVSSWNDIGAWTGQVKNVSIWHDVQSWFGSVEVVEEWYDIGSWSGSVQNTSSWQDMRIWSGTIEETVSSWHDMRSWTGSVKNVSSWNDIENWSGSVKNVENWHDMEVWSGSVANTSAWQDVEGWSGSVSNVSSWHDKVSWTGSLSNVSQWYDIGTWTGNVKVVEEWHDISSWSGSVANTSVWNDIKSWSGSVYNTSDWHDIENWTGSIYEVSSWNDIESWGGSIEVVEVWHDIRLWSGDVANTSVWHDIKSWTGSVSEGVSSWRDMVFWDGSVANTSAWHDMVSWDGSVKVVENWNDVEAWTGQIKNISAWHDMVSWSGAVSEGVSSWRDMVSWTGSLYNTSQWHDLKSWTGSVVNVQNWNDVKSWSGSVQNLAVWNDMASWTVSLETTANWYNIQSWDGSLANVAVWRDLEAWTGSVKGVQAWRDVESWGGTVTTVSVWNDVESWGGSVGTLRNWNSIESWFGQIQTLRNWNTVDSWTGSIKAPSLNHAPNKPKDPSPADGTTGVSTSPTLQVTVTDPDGDNMDVRFYDGGDSLIGMDTNVENGGTASTTWSDLSYSTTYYWYAMADDGTLENTSDVWSFTTKAWTPPPPGWNPIESWTGYVRVAPAEVSTGPATNIDTGSATLNSSITYGSYDNVDVWFDYRPSGELGWYSTPTEENYTGASYSHDLTGLSSGTTYAYRGHINYGDGLENTGSVVEFATESAAPPPPPPMPPTVEEVYDVTVSVEPKEARAGVELYAEVNVKQMKGDEIKDVWVSLTVIGPGGENKYIKSVTKAIRSENFVRTVDTSGWSGGQYVAKAKIGWNGKERKASIAFTLLKAGFIERILEFLGEHPAVILILIAVLTLSSVTVADEYLKKKDKKS